MLAAPLAVRRRARAEAQCEPAAADSLHAGRCRSEYRGVSIGDVGDERAETDRCGRRGQRTEQREALEHRPIALDHRSVEMIEDPGRVVALGLGSQDGVAENGPVVGTGAVLDVDLHVGGDVPAAAIEPTCADGETRTLTCSVLSAVPLPLGYVGFCVHHVSVCALGISKEHTKILGQ